MKYLSKQVRFNESDAESAILKIADLKGSARAKLLEKILRAETAHFTSNQYKLTGSAGMEIGNWQDLPKQHILGYIIIDDSKKAGLEKFIVWDSVYEFLLYLSDYIDRYNGKFERWNSLDPVLQANYKKLVNSVTARFV